MSSVGKDTAIAEMERITEAFRVKVVEPIMEFAEGITKAMLPAMEAFAEAAKGIYTAVYGEYVACGAIYGETDEGFIRWLEEIGEINRLETKAQRLRQQHEDLADFKRMVKKNGRRDEQDTRPDETILLANCFIAPKPKT